MSEYIYVISTTNLINLTSSSRSVVHHVQIGNTCDILSRYSRHLIANKNAILLYVCPCKCALDVKRKLLRYLDSNNMNLTPPINDASYRTIAMTDGWYKIDNVDVLNEIIYHYATHDDVPIVEGSSKGKFVDPETLRYDILYSNVESECKCIVL